MGQRATSPGGPWTDVARSIAGQMMGLLVVDIEITEHEMPYGRIEVALRFLPPLAATEFFRLRAQLIDE